MAASHSGTGATAALTGLANGTAYRLRVRSRNAAGASAWLAGTGTPAVTKTYALSSEVTAAEGANAELTVTLGEAAPAGGLALSVAYDYGGSASSSDTGTTPSTVTVAVNSTTATLTVPLASDDLVEGEETFTATLSTSVSGWVAASSGASGTVKITDGDADAAKVAFGSSASGTAKHAVSVAEDVSAGTVNVPVTVSHLPGASTTFAVEVLGTGTATEYASAQAPGDFRIETKSVTFGPTGSKTKNVVVTVTNDGTLEPDETIELKIAAADETVDDLGDHYARDENGALATVTITNDEHPPAPTALQVKVGDTKLDLSWTAPTLPSGVSLAGYDVHYTSALVASVAADAAVQTGQSPSPASGWVAASHSGTGATAALTGLANGTAYRLRVRSRNAAGASAWLAGTGTPAVTKTYALSSEVTAAEGANAELTVTLGEAAPAGGLALSVAYDYGGSASSSDTGTTPSTVTVAVNSTTATLTVPLASDDLVEGEETFTATLSTSVSGWVAASSGASGTVKITDGDADAAKVAFGSSASGTAKHAVSVAEDVSAGTVNVPVTVSHLPGASTTFAVEVLGTGTATEYASAQAPGDFRIETKSVTFGPTGSKTKNVVVTVTNDGTLEPDETIELKIAAADETVDDLGDHYARDENGALATVTITNDEHPPAPTALQVKVGDTKLDLSWTAPTLPSGVSLAGYDVHYTSALVASVAADAAVQTGESPSPASGWVAASHSGTGATAALTGLANGTAYRLRVRSRNAAGASAWLAGTGTPAVTKTYALSSEVTAAEGANAELTVTLGEAAPAGGLALSVAYDYGGSASSSDTGTTPSTVTVAVNSTTATLTVPLASDDLVEGEETFTATLSTSVSGWVAASSGASGTVKITDGDADAAKVAFGSSASGTAKHAVSVAEDVSAGTVNVPVTVSHLPGASTTFAVEVLGTGTATEYASAQAPGDFRIETKSVTFGPTGSKTKNVVVTVTNDGTLEPDETIELKIAAADETVDDLGDHYARDENGALATVTITNDEHPPAPTALQVKVGDTKLDLSWTAPTLPSGVSLAGYDVHYTSALVASVAADAAVQTGQSPSAADGWVAASHSGTGATAALTGLANGTAYRLRVRSRNAAGASAWLAGTGTPAVTKTYALSSEVTAAEGANAELTVTLGEAAPAGGLALSVAYDYGGSASSSDTGTTPSTVTVAVNSTTATLTVPLASDDLVEGEETFTATLSTSVSGWVAASSGASGTVKITDGDADAAKVAFGSSASGTAKHAVSVAEDVSAGTVNVPVTVSHLPGASTTFAVEVLGTGTATEYVSAQAPGDFRIETKSVTFGPTGSKTKNVVVTVTNDGTLEPDETIELKIAAADETVDDLGDHYARDEKRRAGDR